MPADMGLAAVAVVLGRGRSVDQLSWPLTLVGALLCLLPLAGLTSIHWPLGGLLVALGLAEKYWALRCAIDAELFAMLAEPSASMEQRLADLDIGLSRFGKLSDANGRSLDARIRGALWLLKLQAGCCAAQWAVWLGGTLIITF